MRETPTSVVGLELSLCPCTTHLNTHSEDEARLREQGKGLVVRGVVQGKVGHKEQYQGAVAAVERTLHKGSQVKVHTQLTRPIKLRVLQTPAVVHILNHTHTHTLLQNETWNRSVLVRGCL